MQKAILHYVLLNKIVVFIYNNILKIKIYNIL